MVVKADQEKIRALLKDTITLLCKNGLNYSSEFCVEALIGITLDTDDVFLVSINEKIHSAGSLGPGCGADIELEPTAYSPQSPTPRAVESSSRRKRRNSLRNQQLSKVEHRTSYSEPAAIHGSSMPNFEDMGFGEPPAKMTTISDEEFVLDNVVVKQEVQSLDELESDATRCKEETNISLELDKEKSRAVCQKDVQLDASSLENVCNFDRTAVIESHSQATAIVNSAGDPSLFSQALALGASRTGLPLVSRVTGTPVTGSGGRMNSGPCVYTGSGFQCPACGKVLASKSGYILHVQTHQGLYRLYCPECGKGFQQNSHLEGHLNTHRRSKPFLCRHCQKGFNIKHNMLYHERICRKRQQSQLKAE